MLDKKRERGMTITSFRPFHFETPNFSFTHQFKGRLEDKSDRNVVDPVENI